MPKNEENYNVKVKKLEEGEGNSLKVFLDSSLGEYSFETEKENLNLFCPGKIYDGLFIVSGIPDFVGQKDEWKNVCTVSYCLERILDGENVIYERG